MFSKQNWTLDNSRVPSRLRLRVCSAFGQAFGAWRHESHQGRRLLASGKPVLRCRWLLRPAWMAWKHHTMRQHQLQWKHQQRHFQLLCLSWRAWLHVRRLGESQRRRVAEKLEVKKRAKCPACRRTGVLVALFGRNWKGHELCFLTYAICGHAFWCLATLQFLSG